MKDVDKISYLIEICCINRDDVECLIHWIEHTSIDFVYDRIHYMFDQDDTLKHEM